MKSTLFLFLSLFFGNSLIFGQDYFQYFDGADTLPAYSIIIEMDTAAENIWQIGEPQKTIFNSAATIPNALITDTINHYPINNTSSFTFGVDPYAYQWGGILALQWKQKLDLADTLDGAYIEYSVDTGATWVNAFNNPYIYNFYGFNPNNQDTLANGDVVFSGVDTNWTDIWLCFDLSWLSLTDTLSFRFTLKSDSIQTNQEGWLIDNMLIHATWFHTINEKEQEEYIIVYPNPTTGIVNIQAKKIDEFHIIELMQVIDINGKIVKEFKMAPTKFSVDLKGLPDGVYFLKIKTNIQTETYRIVLQNE